MNKRNINIDTELAYRFTDALLNSGYVYKSTGINICEYINIKENIKYIKYKIPYKYTHIYKFIKVDMNTNIQIEYTKKMQLKEVIKEFERLLS